MDIQIIKKKLEKLKEKNSENIAMHKVLSEKLKSDYKVKDVDDGYKKLKELEKEKEAMVEEYNEKLEILEKEISKSGIL